MLYNYLFHIEMPFWNNKGLVFLVAVCKGKDYFRIAIKTSLKNKKLHQSSIINYSYLCRRYEEDSES